MNDCYIDSHTHARDFELMALAGVKDVVLCSFVPVARYAETLIDHFTETDEIHRPRLNDIGLKAHVFVGVHPRCIPKEWRKILPVIEEYLESGKAVGICEVGLEKASDLELKLAKEYDVPVIVHTPMGNCVNIVNKVLSLAEEC